MTNPAYRHRILIIDRSGSIDSILTGQQDGLDEFFASEKHVLDDRGDKATYSVWDFDDEIRCVNSVEQLDAVRSYQIVPRGMTAMRDAIGDAVKAEGQKLAALPEDERPVDVTVTIFSDGLDNVPDQRHSAAEVKKLLDQQQDVYGWRVIYMGTNQDAIKEGAKYGMRKGSTVTYDSSDYGAKMSYRGMSNFLRSAPVAASVPGGQGYVMDDASRKIAEAKEEDQPEDQSNSVS